MRKPPRSGSQSKSRSSFNRNGNDRSRDSFHKPSRGGRPRQDSWSERSDDRDLMPAPEKKTKTEAVVKAFGKIWSDLFTSPVHLDSALSKQPKHLKSILARIVPTILLRPASQAEAHGIGVPPGEPWSLAGAKIAKWRAAELLTERMYEGMSQRPVDADPVADDFPPMMIEEWEATWGKKKAAELIQILGQEAPLGLRASRRFGAQELARGLSGGLNEGSKLPVKVQASDLSPVGVRLSGYAPVLGTEFYKEGAFEIQDEGSQVMALFALWPDRYSAALSKTPGKVELKKALPPLPDEPPAWTVIDACAGAGGKSLAFADALLGKGRIYSYDTSEKKLQALRRRATHAGFNNIKAVALKDGEEAAGLKRFRHSADVVLVDAPCSGWGVLRRNPDIKWRQTSDVLEKMPKIQLRLLETYSELVAPGGRLVFGVCTFRKDETTGVVEKFLAAHPEFEPQQGGYLGPGPSDGFFMQAFTRKKGSGSK